MEQSQSGSARSGGSLQWTWIAIGIALGGALVAGTLFLVDPRVERPEVAGYVLALSLLLSGLVVGRLSPGETIRETAIVGTVLVLTAGLLAWVFLDLGVPLVMWLFSPLYAVPLTMLGGWVGETIQGTLEEEIGEAFIDWPWVIVSVAIGLTLSTFSVLIASARLGMSPEQCLLLFALSFLATGLMVGYYSPGRTLMEPAIAAGLMAVINVGFLLTWFGDLPVRDVLVFGCGGGIVLAIAGGYVGERMQERGARAVVRATGDLAEP